MAIRDELIELWKKIDAEEKSRVKTPYCDRIRKRIQELLDYIPKREEQLLAHDRWMKQKAERELARKEAEAKLRAEEQAKEKLDKAKGDDENPES